MMISADSQVWPSGGGDMGACIREFDWAGTRLGPIDSWPQSLKTTVDLVLRLTMPAGLYWGRDGIMIYNDALARLTDIPCPGLLGNSIFDGWAPSAAFNRQVIEACFAGESLVYREKEFPSPRGRDSGSFCLDVTYSPVIDESGHPAGVLAIMVETTERVQTEGALRASEARYRTLADLSPDAIFVNAVDTCTYVNQAGVRLLGAQSADEIVGKPGFTYLDPARIPAAQIRLEQVINDQQSHHLVLSRWMRTDGAFIDVEVSTGPIVWEGRPASQVLARDITERRRSEEALRESEERFRTLAELVPDLLWLNDPHGKTIWYNRRWLEYTGQSLEEALDYGWVEAIHPDERDAALHNYQSHVQAGQPFRHERRIRGADGLWRWFLIQALPIRDDNGSIVQWVGAATDVHEERVAREATELARAEADAAHDHLHQILSQLPSAIAVLVGPDHVFELATPPYLELVNRPVIGRTLREAYPEIEGQGLLEQMDEVYRTGVTWEVTAARYLIDQDRDGIPEEHYYNLTYAPLRNAAGEVYAVMIALGEVSAAVRARTELLLAHQTAEQARLEADAAHEYLRSVLAVVPAGIAVMSGREGVFRLVNPAFQQGSGGRQLLGLSYREAFPDFAGQGLLELFERTLATGQGVHYPELRATIAGPDGTLAERYFNTTWVPLRDGHGLISEIVVASVDVTEQVRQRERIDELRQEADSARADLEEAHHALEERVAHRTTQLALANQRLENEVAERKRAEAARSELLQRLVTAEEDERRRIALDIHDGVTQLASAAGLHLDEIASRLPDLPPDDRFELDRAGELIRRAAAESRRLIAGLRPAVLDDFGLAMAIGQEVETMVRQGWNVRYDDALGPERLPSSIDITLFRVAQEALNNVRRHAGPTDIEVRIARRNGEIQLAVRDWGRGFDSLVNPPVSERGGHIGIAAIQERIALLGGSFVIDSRPGIGTQIRVTVPLTEES